MHRVCNFADKTVLLAGAGCLAGMTLARSYAQAGARVIAMDRDEGRMVKVAVEDSGRIEPLGLDPFRPRLCARLGEIWQDEPLDVLIHLQAMRDPNRQGSAVQAIPALTRALLTGLEAGDGRVLVLFRAAEERAPSEMQVFSMAMTQLAKAMDGEVGGPAVTVNALKLGPRYDEGTDNAAMLSAAMWLTGSKGRDTSGAVLPVDARSD